MLRNLLAEMARYNIKNADIASLINKSEQSVKLKILNKSTFSIQEATSIRDTFFPGIKIEYLFHNDGDADNAAANG